MSILRFCLLTLASAALLAAVVVPGSAQERVRTANGMLEGTRDARTGVQVFKGIPFAAPPVGDLRWKEPQPVQNWTGVRKADQWGPRPMQRPLFGDMSFRSPRMSEDCLYLNVWTPAKPGKAKLPVLVYFYGGGFGAGDSSEPRYDGASMAAKGIVAVTVNYRLGVFGFFAHPELSKESPHRASGNYGLLDQAMALRWVRQNIARFGGDPKRVTIAGESAGSISVSALMASPLSKDLIAGAIGESGSILASLTAAPLAEAEAEGAKFAFPLGKGAPPTLADLRQIPAEQLLEATGRFGAPWFRPTMDGYFFPKSPQDIYRAGEQAHVPLLAGVNSEEQGYGGVLGRSEPTVANYRAALARLYPDKVDAVFSLYPATSDAEVRQRARELASDRFISYGTYRWVDLATRTGKKPTYYYLYSRPRPAMRKEMGDATPGLAGGIVRGGPTENAPPGGGAVHSAEIEYALGNLDLNHVYAWTPDDRKVSGLMQQYFVKFIKTGNPNGGSLPRWPRFDTGQLLNIDVTPQVQSTEQLRARYEFLDPFYLK